MTYSTLLRPGMTAIAAVLALSATPAFAQEVTTPPQTVPATPADPVATTPTTAAPAQPESSVTTTTTTTTTEPVAEPTADPLAPAAAAPVAERTTTTRTTRTTRSVRPVTPAPTRATVAARTPAPSTASPVEATVPPAPIVARPVAAAPEPVATPTDTQVVANEDILPIAGAAGLGLIALGGAAFALRRRKHLREEEAFAPVYEEPRMARAEPVQVEAAPVAAVPAAAAVENPAFRWDSPSHAAPVDTGPKAPGSYIAAAKRGPTPENPFLSLKKRLKRASFFEQRDRLVAQGRAKPVPLGAGLPDMMSKAARHVRDTVKRPANAPRELSFSQRYQPA